MHSDEAIPTPELAELNRRIALALKAYKILPYYALQYRISEAGSSRPDPRAIKRALAELAGNRRPRLGRLSAGPSILPDGLYVSNGTSVEQFADYRNALISALTAVTGETATSVSTSLEELASKAGIRPSILTPHNNVKRKICGELEVEVESFVLEGQNQMGVPLSVWLTHDLEWLYPDDARLWRFLETAASAGRAAIIVARKISPATFTVLKALGGSGTQYYSFLVGGQSSDAIAKNAKESGWLHTLPAAKILDHQVANHLTSLSSRAQVPSSGTARMVKNAVRLGLGDNQSAAPEIVKAWAQQHELSAPPVFWIVLDRWSQYITYRRRIRGTITADAMPTATGPQASDITTKPSMEKGGYGRVTEVSRVPFTVR